MNKKRILTGLFSFTFLALASLAISASHREIPAHKISVKLQKILSKEPSTNILVVLKAQADLSGAEQLATKEEKGRFVYTALRAVAQNSQQDLLQFLTTKSLKTHSFYITNMIAVLAADATLIKELSARADVLKIIESPSAKLIHPIIGDDFRLMNTLSSVENSVERIGATKVWSQFHVRGAGIVVAGQDTGVDGTHPALASKYRGLQKDKSIDNNYNWHDSIKEKMNTESKAINKCGYNTTAPCDDDQHGTHTMGTMLGSEGELNQVGVAPDAKWIACRNMDAGVGSPVSYIDCFEWFLAPYPHTGNAFADGKPELAPHVINNSWGCPADEGCAGYEMESVLGALKAAGIFVVASAGNDGPECSTIADQPAQLSDLSFSVGALEDTSDTIAFFSSRGPSKLTGQVGPDVSAPGVNIRSSVPGGGYEGGWSGTSMAGPHVAGAVALLWSAQPKLIGKIKETVALLRATAKPLVTKESCGNIPGSQIPNNTFGYGMIDIAKAVEEALKR